MRVVFLAIEIINLNGFLFRRVINIVTPQIPETSWKIAAQKNFLKSEPLESSPPVPDTLEGLLTPRPIPEITSP